MIGTTCPRCHGPLPEAVVRAMATGTTCPFCSTPLKQGAARSLDALPTDDDGYATFEIGDSKKPAAPASAAVGLRPTAAAKPEAVGLRPAAPPAIKPAAPPAKPAPAPVKVVAATAAAVKPAPISAPGMTTAASPKNMRQTMIGGSFAPRENPFDGTPAPASLALSPPSSAPVSRPSTSPVGAATAAARAVPVPAAPPAAPAPARAAVQAVRTPAPAVRASAPAAAPAAAPRNAAAVMSILDATDSEPTHALSPSDAESAPISLLDASESEPTHAAPPAAPPPAATMPLPDGADSAPVASVMLMPDSAPVVSGPVGLQPVQPRRLAYLGIAMGVGIVLVAFLAIKLVRGRKAPAVPAATEVAKATPEPAPAEPVVVAARAPAPAPPTPATRPPPRAAPAPSQHTSSQEAPAPRPKATAVAHAPKPAVEKRHGSSRRAKARHEHTPRARKVAMKGSVAKSSSAASPAEHPDPRPSYERGNAALLAGDGKGAIAAYREAVKTAPSDPIGFRGLGLAYEHEGETALAIKALRRYLKLAPDADDRTIITRRLDRLARQAKHK